MAQMIDGGFVMSHGRSPSIRLSPPHPPVNAVVEIAMLLWYVAGHQNAYVSSSVASRPSAAGSAKLRIVVS